MRFRVHLVEDDPNLNEVLTSYLKAENWEVCSFLHGREAEQAVSASEPHLWILDIMLPDVHGYDLLRSIKGSNPAVPVIFISARDAELDRVLGLELGSDDYIAKPFLPKELVIRARRQLERVYGGGAPQISRTIFVGEYEVDPDSRVVRHAGETIYLTAKEFDLLLFLANHAGQALSRDQLLNGVWGEDYFGSGRVVDDVVRRVRRKVPLVRIETVYGYGYRVVAV